MNTATTIKPRIAFAGVGWIGRNRMEAVVNTGLADVAGIADPSKECIEAAAGSVAINRRYNSFAEIISDPDADAVVIATPSAMHMEQAVHALQHGKAVFCQKPLGRNANEVRAVVEAARNADLLLGADFSYRYTQAFQIVHELISSGTIGEVFAAELKFHNAYGPGKPWFYDLEQAGGGCVLDLGVHLIDLLLFAFEFPGVGAVSSTLMAGGKRMATRNIVEDYGDVSIQLNNGVQARLSCSWNLHAGTEAVIEASFYGTKGAATMRNINGSFYDFGAWHMQGTRSTVIAEPPDNWGGKAIVHWLNRLATSNKFREDAETYLASAEVIDRIYANN